jgi:ribosomal protein S20
MTSSSGVGGPRPAPAPVVAPQAKASSSGSTAEIDAARAEAQSTMKSIEKKPAKELTADDRANYATAAGADKIYESAAYLGYLGKNAAESVSKKMTADVNKYLADNPNASLADIKKYVADRFKAHVGSATVGKFAFDQAIKMMNENAERMKDAFEF